VPLPCGLLALLAAGLVGCRAAALLTLVEHALRERVALRGVGPVGRALILGVLRALLVREHHLRLRVAGDAPISLDEVRAFSIGLAELDVERDDRVAIVGSNRPRLYWAMCAAQACAQGATLPGLDQRSQSARAFSAVLRADQPLEEAAAKHG